MSINIQTGKAAHTHTHALSKNVIFPSHLIFGWEGGGGVAIKDTLKSIVYGQVSRVYFLLFIAMTNPRTELKDQILELFSQCHIIFQHISL